MGVRVWGQKCTQRERLAQNHRLCTCRVLSGGTRATGRPGASRFWRGREPPHSIPTGASVKLLLFVYNRVRSFLNFRNKKINSNDQSSLGPSEAKYYSQPLKAFWKILKVWSYNQYKVALKGKKKRMEVNKTCCSFLWLTEWSAAELRQEYKYGGCLFTLCTSAPAATPFQISTSIF